MNYTKLFMMVLCSIVLTAGCATSVNRGIKFSHALVINRGSATDKGITQTSITGVITNIDRSKKNFSLHPDDGSKFIQNGFIYEIGSLQNENSEILVSVSKNSKIQWDLLSVGKKVSIISNEDSRDSSLNIIKMEVQ